MLAMSVLLVETRTKESSAGFPESAAVIVCGSRLPVSHICLARPSLTGRPGHQQIARQITAQSEAWARRPGAARHRHTRSARQSLMRVRKPEDTRPTHPHCLNEPRLPSSNTYVRASSPPDKDRSNRAGVRSSQRSVILSIDH